MLANVKFWLLESSSSIAKASLAVMILKSSFLYSLYTIKPYFTRKATPPHWPVERSFLIESKPGILKLCFLLRNVSFSAIPSITISFRYNSSSLRFGLIPWQFQNKMVVPMEYLSWLKMHHYVLRWLEPTWRL